jgi:uncharacterized protein YqgC (DUF456 family)
MTWDQILGLSLALLCMGVGVIGTLVPALPGTPIILGTAVVHRLVFGEAGPSTLVLGVLALLALVGLGLDYVASIVGAKKFGATWRGVVGAILGAIVGIFFSLPGILLGPLLGAALGELLGGRKWPEAARAGFGATVGLLVGAIGKLACAVAMVALFAVNVILRSGPPP